MISLYDHLCLILLSFIWQRPFDVPPSLLLSVNMMAITCFNCMRWNNHSPWSYSLFWDARLERSYSLFWDATLERSYSLFWDATLERSYSLFWDATLERSYSLFWDATLERSYSFFWDATLERSYSFFWDATLERSYSFFWDATLERSYSFFWDATLERDVFEELNCFWILSPCYMDCRVFVSFQTFLCRVSVALKDTSNVDQLLLVCVRDATYAQGKIIDKYYMLLTAVINLLCSFLCILRDWDVSSTLLSILASFLPPCFFVT